MDIREILKRIIYVFFFVWGLLVIRIYIIGTVLGWGTIYLNIFRPYFLIALLSSLTHLTHYSKKEVTGRRLIIRLCIQCVLIVGITLSVTYFSGWIYSMAMAISVVISVLVIFVIVALIEWFAFFRLTSTINKKLKDKFR
ncbi:MAG: hypothetical protein FWE42_06330 [Defluviitaleaceae bacterium]|nr:hypothetical protein [Defluviitaleaceae bacterium]